MFFGKIEKWENREGEIEKRKNAGGGKASKIKVIIRRQIYGLSECAFCTSIYGRVGEYIDVHVFMY